MDSVTAFFQTSDWKMHCEKSSIYSEVDADINVDFRGSVVDVVLKDSLYIKGAACRI